MTKMKIFFKVFSYKSTSLPPQSFTHLPHCHLWQPLQYCCLHLTLGNILDGSTKTYKCISSNVTFGLNAFLKAFCFPSSYMEIIAGDLTNKQLNSKKHTL